MSDEFERSGRSFKDGDDPMWTGIDRSDDDQTAQGKKSLQYYNSSMLTTEHGNLVITTNTQNTKWRGWNPYKKKYETMKRTFKSGMIQSWNKFCFTGGIMEVDVQFPGRPDVGGLWPAVWMLGNLGRAVYEASTNKLWPWSYSKCDRSMQRAQEISACMVTDHYSLHPKQGRGSTEIDVIEVMPGPSDPLPIVKNHLRRPYSSMTLQIAPGISNKKNRPPSGTLPEWGFEWYDNITYGANTSINPFFYGTYLAATKSDEPIGRSAAESYQCDSISSMMQLNHSFWEDMHRFRLEWQPGTDGYIHWYVDDVFRFGVEAAALKKTDTFIPREPSYLIMNTAISTSWGFPAPPIGCDEYDCKTTSGRCGMNPGFCESLPAKMKIGHVRVYQNKKDPLQYVGCNPEQYPTTRFINGHKERYMKPFDAEPLKKVKAGGGVCRQDSDCGGDIHSSSSSKQGSKQSSSSSSSDRAGTSTSTSTSTITGTGTCGVLGRCSCDEDWTGPNCLVPNYRNDFPNWDVEDWSNWVPPSVPLFLGIAAVVFLAVMLLMIVIVARKRAQAAANTTSSTTTGGINTQQMHGNGGSAGASSQTSTGSGSGYNSIMGGVGFRNRSSGDDGSANALLAEEGTAVSWR